jgi:hypothetical protein
MGANLVTLTVSGPGDRAGLHAAIWEAGRDLVERYTASASNRPARDYLVDAVPAAQARGEWGVDGDRLVWSFDDVAGARSRSAGVWAHWLWLALAADWGRVAQLAGEHDLGITSPMPVLADLLAGDEHFLTLRDDLWSAGLDGLHGDDRFVALDDLGPDEKTQHEQARLRCRCGPCVMLRPEADVLRALLSGLVRPEAAASAAWYLARISQAAPEVLTALVRAGDVDVDGLVPSVERYAGRVPDAEAVLVDLLPRLSGGALGLALYGLAGIRTSPATQAVLLDRARAALVGSDAAAEAAAEIVGRIGREDPRIREQLGAVLARDGLSDRLRHNTVLGLVNLHLPPSPPPGPGVLALLERESTEDSDAGRLARWLLGLLPGSDEGFSEPGS